MLKNIVVLSLRLMCAAILGVLINIALVQHDQWAINAIENAVNKAFSKALQACFTCKVQSINVFAGSCVITNLYSSSYNKQDWNLSLDSFKLSVLWIESIKQGMWVVDCSCNKLVLESLVKNNQIECVKAVQSFLAAPTVVPLVVKSFSLQDASLTLKDPFYKHCGNVEFSCFMVQNKGVFKNNLIVSAGSFSRDNINILENIAGTISCNTQINNSKKLEISDFQMNISVDVVKAGNILKKTEHCKVTGFFDNQHGRFRVHNLEHSFISNCLLDCNSELWRITWNAHIPLNLFDYYCNSPCKGTAIIQSRYEWTFEGLTGNSTLNIKDFFYNNKFIGELHSTIHVDLDFIKTFIHAANEKFSFKGEFCWSLKELLGSFRLYNDQEIKNIYGFTVSPSNLLLTGTIDRLCNGSMQAFLTLDKNSKEAPLKIQSKMSKVNNNLVIESHLAQDIFKCIINLNSLSLSQCSYESCNFKDTSCLFAVNNGVGCLDYNFVKRLASLLGYSLGSGTGVLNFSMNSHSDAEELNFDFNLSNANIRIPGICNIVKACSGCLMIDLHKKIIKCRDVVVSFYKGALKVPSLTVWLDKSWHPYYICAPILCDNILINYGKELIALATGSIVFTYDESKKIHKLYADIALSKSHIHSLNVIPSFPQKNLTSLVGLFNVCRTIASNTVFDVVIKTENPLHIKTPLVVAQVHGDFSYKGLYRQANVSGVLTLIDGKILFPYKPLYLSTGKVILNSSNLMGSSVEILARNNINKYTITLSVNGFLNKPLVRLDSAPYLKEEQILTLLLAGSEEGSLSVAMPHMIMQTLESVILHKKNDNSRVRRFLKALLKSLKHIRIVPRISNIHNSSDTSTIKGALEFDINDRIKATIQNSLNLSENTRVEVECTLSDDMSVKAVKDGKGDLEAELEMKWKF